MHTLSSTHCNINHDILWKPRWECIGWAASSIANWGVWWIWEDEDPPLSNNLQVVRKIWCISCASLLPLVLLKCDLTCTHLIDIENQYQQVVSIRWPLQLWPWSRIHSAELLQPLYLDAAGLGTTHTRNSPKSRNNSHVHRCQGPCNAGWRYWRDTN